MASERQTDLLTDLLYSDNGKAFWTFCTGIIELGIWDFLYGPLYGRQSDDYFQAKCNLVASFRMLILLVVDIILLLYVILEVSCHHCYSLLLLIVQIVWAGIKEPWMIVTGQRYENFRRLVLSVYYSILHGPRFLLLFLHELHVNLELLRRGAEL